MNKFDYDSKISKIKLLEIKKEKIIFEKEYLDSIKPAFYERKKKKDWEEKRKIILNIEQETSNNILLAYQELEKLFSKFKNNC